jgi:iron complex outermembrane receptor protein
VKDETTNILNYVEGFSSLVKSGTSGRRISRTGIRKRAVGDDLFAEALAGRGLGAEQRSFSVTSNLGLETDIGNFNLIVGNYSLDQEFVLDFFDGGLGGQGYSFGGFTIANDGDHNQLSVELKYTKSFFDGFADVIGGVYYFRERNTTDFSDIFGTGAAPGAPLTLADRILKNNLKSIAGYAQSDFHLTDQLTFTAGARWTQETKSINFVDQRAAGVGGVQRLDSALIAAQGIPLEDQKALITPRFVLAYDFTDNIGVFASATKGFKSGGWNARGTRADRIQPFGRESAWSYEAGLRSQIFDNMLRFNLTGFWLDVKDFQVPSAFVDGLGSIQFITRNFADLRNRGVEVEATFAPTEGLDLYAALGLQDAEYRNVDPTILAQATACLTNPAQGGLGIVAPNCSIAAPVRVPDFSLTLGAAYEFAIPGTGFSFTPSVNARHASSTFTGTSNLPNSFEDGFWLLNAGVVIASDKHGLQFSAECTNCNNTIYVQSNLPPTVYINEPRRWGVKLKYRF